MTPMQAHLYAGPLDGAEIAVGENVSTFIARETYRLSTEWTAWFGRRTFVVAGFKGNPPATRRSANA